jgi:ssDNA-specific exonuclease RecJ
MLIIEILSALSGKTKEEVLSNLDGQDISAINEYVEVFDTKRKLEDIENSVKNSKPDVIFIDFLQNIEQS